MRLKTFTAANVQDAMRQVRAALGDDAVIVATRRTGRGAEVRITAALEEGDSEAVEESLAPSRRGVDDGDIARVLAYHGVPARTAERLRAAWRSAAADGMGPRAALAQALGAELRFAPLAPERGRRGFLLVGPPGAGKTATLAKLAARAVLGGGAVAAFSLDAGRTGGVAQLEGFTKALSLPLVARAAAADIVPLLATMPTRTLGLVDRGATNPFDRDDLAALTRDARALPLEPLLVLPAGGDAQEMTETAWAFSTIGVRRMVVTKVDAARRLGGLLGAAHAASIALTEIGVAPFVVDGLSALAPESLADLLLRDPSALKRPGTQKEAAP